MSTAVLLAVLVVMLLVSFALPTATLWLMARICRVPQISLGRAAAAALLLLIANVVLDAIALVLMNALPANVAVQGGIALVVIALSFYICFAIVKRVFRTQAGRALLVAICTLVLNGIIGVGGSLAIRAKLSEAFIVPTGTCALTILGQHYDAKCPYCGYTFAVGALRDEDAIRPLREELPVVCPNCGQIMQVARGTSSTSGDRILVDKTTAPKRWDLVAFHRPSGTGPTTYVKRLVGLPGEKLVLAQGHLYINGTVLHRLPDEQTDLWVPVNDTAFVPAAAAKDAVHWEPGAGSHWSPSGSRWSCDAREGDELLLRGAITDFLAYNEPLRGVMAEPFAVGDIRLELSIGSFTGTGGLSVRWSFAGHRLDVGIAGDGDTELHSAATDGGGAAADATGKLSGPISAGERLSVVVRDGRGYLCENGRTRASLAIESEKIDAAGELLHASHDLTEPATLAITARNCKVDLSRIVLDRDHYFRPITADEALQTIGAGPVQLRSDEYFVIGDNTALSQDSRSYGPIKTQSVIGVARWIYWPPKRWHTFQ